MEAYLRLNSSLPTDMIRHGLFIGAFVAIAPRLTAQTSGKAPSQIVRAARVKHLADSLAPLGSKSAPLGQGANFSYTLWHRDTSGGLERHEAWADVLVVQSGSATILAGGVQDGATESSPGEWRGGTARGATRQVIRAGDVVTTPAGTPHQMILAPGEKISYIVFKIAAAQTRTP
jgi:mannose-6-phosphate isomerase-like protein (cupin superfamily)